MSLANNAVESAKAGTLSVSIEGIALTLLAKRGVYWPSHKTLFIADTHFGKEVTFRSHGIAAPRGSTQGTLATISEMISECGASRLILLGDMFHARSSISQDIRDSLDDFFQSHENVKTSLVLGNHDRGIQAKIQSWPIEILAPGFVMDSISISHFPQPPSPLTKVLLCGHLHPAYRLKTKTDSIGKLPCFWLSDRQLVLPAIGEFTGTKAIQPSKSDKTWVVVDNEVFPVQ